MFHEVFSFPYLTHKFVFQAVLLRGVTCSEVRAEELALELDPNVQVKEEARRLSEQSNLSDQAQYQHYPCGTDDVVSYCVYFTDSAFLIYKCQAIFNSLTDVTF